MSTATLSVARPAAPSIPTTRIKRPGAILAAAVMLALASQPGLLPHVWWVQAITGGLAAAQGYGLAALLSHLTRRITIRDDVRRLLRALALPGAAAVLGVGLLAAYPGQLAVAAATNMAGPPLLAQGLAVAGSVLVATAVVWLARGVRKAARHPRRAAVLAVAPALALLTTAAASTYAIPGADVGTKGKQFLAMSNPTGATRVYVGKDAGDPARRAQLAVQELKREGGFDKGTLLIDVPTGSGWVNPGAVRSLEKLTGGDVATVAVQYAASPSWWAYLKGGEGVQQTVRALVDAIEAEHPKGKVLIYGESLGAWGGLRAYDKPDAVTNHLDGALWAGVPGGAPAQARNTTTLIHADDPVPAWAPSLMVERGHAWPRPWLPLSSFWVATADVISAPATPEGFGHRYGDEVTEAWRTVLVGGPTYDSAS